MFLIYTREITPRVSYVFQLIFDELLSIEYSITTDPTEIERHQGPGLVYDHCRIKNFLWVEPAHLLFENELKKYNIEVKSWNGLPSFFHTASDSDLPFDLFAASFYLVSRYEEYFPQKIDKHGRFRAKHSLAKQNGFLEVPVINRYADELKLLILKKYPAVLFPDRAFNLKCTIDIDNAYAFQHKGLMHNMGSVAAKLFRFRFKQALTQLMVVCRLRQDPYDSYEQQKRIHQRYGIQPLYFFLLGDKSKYDRNLSHSNTSLRKLILNVGATGTLGIHPSYSSFGNATQIALEKERLELIVNQKIIRSRQHYIRLRIPQTYQNLIEAGIKEDYSMGYPSRIGFRASICSPHYFFDLEANKASSLRVNPFCVMDTTLKQYMKVRSTKVIHKVQPLLDQVSKVNGEFCIVFHNESIAGWGVWKHWRDVYEQIIKTASAKRA